MKGKVYDASKYFNLDIELKLDVEHQQLKDPASDGYGMETICIQDNHS